MTVAGVSIKTLILLRRAGGRRRLGLGVGHRPVGVDLGSGYANTTVTIPGGFWLASFGAFLLGIFIAVQPRRAALLGVLYAVCEGSASARSPRCSTPRPTASSAPRSCRPRASSWSPCPLRHPHRQADPEDGLRRGRRAWAGCAAVLSSCSSCRSSTGTGSTATSFRTIGIVVTLLAIVLAALSLVLDFGTIEAGVQAGARRSSSGTWPSG